MLFGLSYIIQQTYSIMKKLIYLPLFSLVILFSSCDFDFDFGLDLIPDIDEIVDGVYTVNIDSDLTTGYTYTDSLDLNQFEEYETYRENISSYDITKITCEIIDFDAPEDLWFSGTVIAHDMDSTVSVVIAEFEGLHLYQVAADSLEVQLVENEEGLSQVVAWMEESGKFKFHIEYLFENEDGTPYLFGEEDYGDSFKIKLNFSLLLETKL